MLFAACTQKQTTSVTEKGELVVAMDIEMPGYFVLGGENFGYQYDILKAYADNLGVELKIVGESDPRACSRMIRGGEVDMVATLDSHTDQIRGGQSVPVCNTSYVLLSKKGAKRKAAGADVIQVLDGASLLISSSFKGTQTYHKLLDSLNSTDIYISSRNSFELIEALGAGDYDFAICEMSESQLGCAMTRGVEQVLSFDEQVGLSIVVREGDYALEDDFRDWLTKYRGSKEYAMLNYMYFDKGIVRQYVRGEWSRIGGISVYDKIIKRVSEESGHDWRFISAIAYNESRFNARITSRAGAQGLMQVMPEVARRMGDGNVDLMTPEHNVMMGIKILDKIQSSLKFPKGTSDTDRYSIVLACYNAGIGHVMDARRLAEKYGSNPNSWEDVSFYLCQKSSPEYANDEVVKCGKIRGRETLAFVDNVISKYRTYCNAVAR